MYPPIRMYPWTLQDPLVSLPAQLAVERYLEALGQIAPDLATQACVGPGNEGTVYVYIPLPVDEEHNLTLHEAMADIGAALVAETGVVIVLMPLLPAE